MTFHSDHKGTALNYEVLADTVSDMRCGAVPMGAGWKKRIEEDYVKREKKGKK